MDTFLFTTEDLRRLFIEYNERYFGGRLQTPRFRLIREFGGIYAGYRRDNDGHPPLHRCAPMIHLYCRLVVISNLDLEENSYHADRSDSKTQVYIYFQK